MLDTNIVSDLMRHPQGRAAQRQAAHGDAGLCVSIVTAAELRFGIAKAGSRRLGDRLDAVLATIDVVPFASPADIHYGALRAKLQAAGIVIGPNDLFIAAHALALQVTLVTRNLAEFSRVPGLVLEDWLA